MTTNHLERLDPALIRPGRADVHVELGLVGANTARALFERFFPDHFAAAAEFEAALGMHLFSPATIQGWLLRYHDNPEAEAQPGELIPRTESSSYDEIGATLYDIPRTNEWHEMPG
ncbi:chaperone BCS1 [Paracoccus saliphilus]|nr:chaperone BCS1 [Paracoccus saliphilus]